MANAMHFLHCCNAAIPLARNSNWPYIGTRSAEEFLPAIKRLNTMILSHILHAWRQWRAYNANLRELNRLGDRELADIGLTRNDIPRVAWESSDR